MVEKIAKKILSGMGIVATTVTTILGVAAHVRGRPVAGLLMGILRVADDGNTRFLASQQRLA